MPGLIHTDSYKSYKAMEGQVDSAVKSGQLDRNKAGQILKDAKENYRENKYNKLVDRINDRSGEK